MLPISTSIAEQPEPRERMVQVVKWYLSAFHAGRKGSVAKKPYNPILGEVFYCHWDLPSEADDASPLMVRTRSSVVSVLLTNVNKVKPLWACVSGSWREENKKNKCCFYLFLFLFFNLFHENLNEPLKHNRMIVCFFLTLTLFFPPGDGLWWSHSLVVTQQCVFCCRAGFSPPAQWVLRTYSVWSFEHYPHLLHPPWDFPCFFFL